MNIAVGVLALILPLGLPFGVPSGTLPSTCPATTGPGTLRPPAARFEALAVSETLRELYEGGLPFREFLAKADRRKRTWDEHYRNGEVSEALVERARSVPGSWRLLAIAEDWCSDSVSTIPYLALLVERVPALEMRVIDSEAGREIMDEHRTPDGRAATPTVLVLNERYEEAGCWVERPADLQAWAMESRAELSDAEFMSQKSAWYREDAGESTVREVLEAIEAAATGSTICSSK